MAKREPELTRRVRSTEEVLAYKSSRASVVADERRLVRRGGSEPRSGIRAVRCDHLCTRLPLTHGDPETSRRYPGAAPRDAARGSRLHRGRPDEAYEQGREVNLQTSSPRSCSVPRTRWQIPSAASLARSRSLVQALLSRRSARASREELPPRGDRPERVRGRGSLVREPGAGLGVRVHRRDRSRTGADRASGHLRDSIATVPGGVVRREFVDRFLYVVVFVETQDLRQMIMIRRGSSSPVRWRSRV